MNQNNNTDSKKETLLTASGNTLISEELIKNDKQFMMEYHSDKCTGFIYFSVVIILLISVFVTTQIGRAHV